MRTTAWFGLGLIVLFAGALEVRAAVPKVDVSNDSITCNTVLGTVTIKPALSNAGSPSTPTSVSVKGTVSGCKADPTTPLLQTSSTVTVVSNTGGVHGETLNGGTQSYADLKVNSSGVTGAFTGGNAGATSSNESVSSEDLGAILSTCATTKGLKTIHIGLGTFTLS